MKKGRVPAPVCLLSGGDGYWTSYACKMLTAAVPADDRDLRVDELSDPSVSEILLSVSLPSLTGEGKITVVTDRGAKLTQE